MKLSSLQPLALSLLRAVAAFTFACHGAQKLFGVFGGTRVSLISLLGLAGVLELSGGILLLLGLFSRPVAFLLSGEMAVAYFRTHAPHQYLPILNHGELAVLYCFIFLFIAVAGPGPVSLDKIWRRKT